MNQHVPPPASTRSEQDGRMKANRPITHTTCRCGKPFTYRQANGVPRTLCAPCTLTRQRGDSARIKEERRDRVKALPKTWNTETRWAYISAESHLNKALVQMLELPGHVRAELLMRFVSVSSAERRARSMPKRDPQSD